MTATELSNNLKSGKKIRGISFKDYPKRKDLFPKNEENEFAPLYCPNKEFSKKRLTQLCLSFGKVTGRGSFMDHQKPKKNPLPFKLPNNLNSRPKNCWKSSTVVEFRKTAPREKNPDSKLPCFMQNGDNSRFSMNCILEKSLNETNHFKS